MPTRSIDIAAIESATGCAFADWVARIDGFGGRLLAPEEIAHRLVSGGGAPEGWAQSITVAYEQHIGRRRPIQDKRGDLSIAVSKTVSGDADHAMLAWLRLVGAATAFDEVPFVADPVARATEDRRRWTVTLADNSRVVAAATERGGGRSVLSVTHENLADADELQRWRGWWRRRLSECR